jgi:NADPH-dependent ferric siderophore reductase
VARDNLRATRVKPDNAGLLTLRVVRREQISPHFVRVTLGGGDIAQFGFMGFDQWFRLFIPVAEDSLSRLPRKLDLLSYAKYLTIAKAVRPVLRNYSVRAYRRDGADGPELDVDVVIHGSQADGTAGPGATWALSCAAGDPVGLLDEGVGYHPDPSVSDVLLVADESGLPATAGILASLPADTTGRALLEVPSEEDRQSLRAPAGVEITWLVRTSDHAVPGHAALDAATALSLSGRPGYGWVVGEQNLPSSLRRHWVRTGLPKQNIMFCGYWKSATAP